MRSDHDLINKKQNTKVCCHNEEGERRLRVYNSKKLSRLLVKCSCCEEQVELFYELEDKYAFGRVLEINGVIASVEEWKKVLLPLLEME